MGKLIILSTTILLSIYFTEQAEFLSKEHIEYINRVAKTWKAKENFLPDTSKEQIMQLLGSKKPKDISERITKENNDLMYVKDNHIIPTTFDSRTQWPSCTTIGTIRNQGYCGSCWAHSTTSVFADRLCIKTKGSFNKLVSAEELAFCCSDCGDGCEGGDPYIAWKFFKTHGIVTGGNYNTSDGCQPYTIPPCIHLKNVTGSCYSQPMTSDPVCFNTCYGDKTIDYNKDHHKAQNVYYIYRPHNMQIEIKLHGPIEASFKVFDDFPSYASGVYKKTEDAEYLGLHSVKIIGWGEEDNVPYWLVVNSWGEQFGDKGLFKILRGHNECSIEDQCTAGIPTRT